MLKNAYLLAKIGADTGENEPHFAEILPIGRRVADRRESLPIGSSVRHLRARAVLVDMEEGVVNAVRR